MTEIKPVSAPPAKQLTPEEKRQRFAELRKRMGRSQIEVTAPPGKTGYWAPVDDSREMGRLTYLGFQVVHDDPKNPSWKANGLKADGTYVIGDVILMEVETDIYDFLQNEYIETNIAHRQNAPRVFIEEAGTQGVPTFEVAKAPR